VLEQARGSTGLSDLKMLSILEGLQEVGQFEGNWNKVADLAEQRLGICRKNNDTRELIRAQMFQIAIYYRLGDWRQAFSIEKATLNEFYRSETKDSFLKYTILNRSVHWVQTGRYNEAEKRRVECTRIAKELNLVREIAFSLSWLGYIKGLQDKPNATGLFVECKELLPQAKSDWIPSMLDSYWGSVLSRQGRYAEAEQHLRQSLDGKRLVDPKAVPLVQAWRGELNERRRFW